MGNKGDLVEGNKGAHEEEPEVEGHGFKGDIAEGNKGAHDEDEVEAHLFKSNLKDNLKDNLKEGNKG